MCFSAEASFAGGVIISAVGVAVVNKIHKPQQLLFACIPIFFGIQQFTEGMLWISIPNPQYFGIQKISTYIFLFMADVLWPVLIPVSILLMEENSRKKKIIRYLFFAGLTVSLYYSYCLVFLNVTPQIMGYHIKYNNDFSKLIAIPAFILYLVATIPALFISSIRRMHIFGAFMLLSCVVTALFFTQYLTSVWCFFAAIISGVIYWILSDSKKKFLFDRNNLLEISQIKSPA
jgi:hypothetical protein